MVDMKELKNCPFCGVTKTKRYLTHFKEVVDVCQNRDCEQGRSLLPEKERLTLIAKDKAEIESLTAQLNAAEDLIQNEIDKIGAIDGYDYNSGVEYGLRLALLKLNEAALNQQEGKI